MCSAVPKAALPALSSRCGGVAIEKGRRIQQILTAIEARAGSPGLGRLHAQDDAAAGSYLRSCPAQAQDGGARGGLRDGTAGVPVDTHVRRIAWRLGWVPANSTADQAHQMLAPRVPPGIRYDLHAAMITHGRTACHAARPSCGTCVLLGLCPCGSTMSSRASRASRASRGSAPGRDEQVRLRVTGPRVVAAHGDTPG